MFSYRGENDIHYYYKVWYVCSDAAPNMINGKQKWTFYINLIIVTITGIAKELNKPRILEILDDDEEEEDDDDNSSFEVEEMDQVEEVEKVKECVEELALHISAQKLVRTSRTRFKRIDCSAHVVNLCKFYS